MDSDAPTATTSSEEEFAKPSFPNFSTEPPAGVPPLIEDAGLRAALGGAPIPTPMRRIGLPQVSTPPAAPEPLAGPALAGFTGTFAGDAGDPILKGQVQQARAALGKIITAFLEAEAVLPVLLGAIDSQADKAKTVEGFDVIEATHFYMSVGSAMESIRQS
jgi:hypothetical protein